MCEMKFYSDEFVVSKDYNRILSRRVNKLAEALPKKMAIHSTLITTYGLKYSEYSGSFDKVLTMEALFG